MSIFVKDDPLSLPDGDELLPRPAREEETQHWNLSLWTLLLFLLLLIASFVLHLTVIDKASLGRLINPARSLSDAPWELQRTAVLWPSVRLTPLDAVVVQQCVGWGSEVALDVFPSSSSLLSSSSSSPRRIASGAESLLTCSLSPSSMVSTFFSAYQAQFPGLLTHMPQLSCERGVFVLIDNPYRDGMGNSMWSYALAVSIAMALNATLVHDPFVATHDEAEGNNQRDSLFRFAEWEAHREWWERCNARTMVKRNIVWLEQQPYDWAANDPTMATTRQRIREIQVQQAAAANTSFMGQTLTAMSTVRFLNTSSFLYSTIQLPRVDFISPGITVRVKAIYATHDWGYFGGMYSPSLEVVKLLEMRYLSQQDGWRRRLFPQDLEPLGSAARAKQQSSSIISSNSGPLARGRLTRGSLSWQSSETIHVSIPIRRGDVTSGMAGSNLQFHMDLRSRVMTDQAVVDMINNSISLIRAVPASLFNLSLSGSGGSALHSAAPSTVLSGQDIVDRLMFTVYSEGRPQEFAELERGLLSLGLQPHQVRLQLGGRTSVMFALMVESDLIYLSPSSFSYAAACYFNSESLKVGSGWAIGRFWGCRNFHYARWTHFLPAKRNSSVFNSAAIMQPQQWAIQDAADFQHRIVRLVRRKEEQRRRLDPIVLDNYHDYPPQWLYKTREQRDIEVQV